MNKMKTKYQDIDWDNVDLITDIDWSNIDFLVHYTKQTTWYNEIQEILYIKRHESIPQIGGLETIIAYSKNFIRKVEELFPDSDLVLENINENQIFDIGFKLARGAEVELARRIIDLEND